MKRNCQSHLAWSPLALLTAGTLAVLVGLDWTAAAGALGDGAGGTPGRVTSGTAQLPPIEQISRNTQPGWGKVYASVSAAGWYVALISNGDPAPGSPGNADGSWEVYRRSAAGEFVQVTNSRAERPPPLVTGTSAPSISSDGRRIAFASMQDLTPGEPGNADGSWEVYLWAEAQGLRQLTTSPGGNEYLGSHQPWISADGTRVAFASDRHGRVSGAGIYAEAQTDVYLWDEATGVQRLTAIASPSRRAWMPRLSGDGRSVAFYSNADLSPGAPGNADGTTEVFLWSAASGFRQISRQAGGRALGLWSAPAVSFDGRAVAFDADADLTPGRPGNPDGSTEVFLWTDGAGLVQVTNLPQGQSARSPALSANGQQLAFVSTGDLVPGAPGNSDGGQELFVRSPAGALRQLTLGASAGGIALPILSGGGEVVAFLSDRDLAVGNQVLTPQTFVVRLGEPHPPQAQPTPTPKPTAVSGPAPRICPQIVGLVPEAVQQAAIANPETVFGWLDPLNPAIPPGPGNPLRMWLAILAPSKPFGPGNPVIWKAGCP